MLRHQPKQTVGTPQKRIKLNEGSTLEQTRGNKTSIFDRLFIVGKLNRKNSQMQMRGAWEMENVEVSGFQMPNQSGEKEEQEVSESQGEMLDEYHQLENLSRKIPLARKHTCLDTGLNEQELKMTIGLYRNSSNFQTAPRNEEVRLGDNIYLRQMDPQFNQLEKMPKVQLRRESEQSPKERLLQDYEIEQSLQHHAKHESFICLNKIQRIFYYVKKIHLQQHSEELVHDLTGLQMRTYNQDGEGHLLRFYQSWAENHCLYLTFEVAVTSLEDYNKSGIRMRENQVWQLIRDCCSTLKWLSDTAQLAHLNIKPGNILKCQRKFKMADFYGRTSALQHCLTVNPQFNAQYLAPEIRNFKNYLQGIDLQLSDMYSLGMCIVENLMGDQYIPKDSSLRAHLQNHLHGYSPALQKTLARMVSLHPEKRPVPGELCSIRREVEGEKARSGESRRYSV